jgi:hypothetical protein
MITKGSAVRLCSAFSYRRLHLQDDTSSTFTLWCLSVLLDERENGHRRDCNPKPEQLP